MIRISRDRLYRILLSLLGIMMWLSCGAQVQELYLKGMALSNSGTYDEARNILQEALVIDKYHPECLLDLARVCYLYGEKEEALSNLEKLESNTPGMGSFELARIHASSGNAIEAVKHLRKHLNSSYKLPYSEILLEKVFWSIENTKEWRDLWSVNWYTENEELLQEIRYLIKSGDYLPALEKIDDELSEKENWDAIHAERGSVLLKMGQKQGAVQSYSFAIDLNSSCPQYYSGRADAYTALKKHRLAVSDLEKAYRMEPENFELLPEIALQYQLDEQYSKAVAYLEIYLDYYPDNIETRYRIGQIHFKTGSYLDALKHYNACLQIETSDSRFFAARGQTYLKTHTYKYALNDFGMALDLNPDDPEIWYLKAEARWYLNDRKGALGDWERAARLGSYDASKKLKEHAPQ